jgi:hypothetical protein
MLALWHAGYMKTQKVVKAVKEELANTGVRLPRSLWDAARHRAIVERCPVQAIVKKALEIYLESHTS